MGVLPSRHKSMPAQTLFPPTYTSSLFVYGSGIPGTSLLTRLVLFIAYFLSISSLLCGTFEKVSRRPKGSGTRD
jgi:hypothetical protein